ncbi:MAG: FtsW/RodA/SpoVE family cell cycle protein [Elusimicrobiota bacterium]|nr:rod shape-determining protein RodA [Endomicrobiia bacterium]MDW8165477.1 FtsW/RodA/SpoVE family cell cycle protein [Elusimicrobiota bacterium]
MEINKYLFLEKETNIIKKVLKNTNWRLIICVILLTIIGLIMIFSATFYGGGISYILKQLLAFCIGMIFLFLLSVISYQIFQPYYIHIYFICILLLVLVLLIGVNYRNTKAWIDFGIFLFQPSELVRILIILSFSGYLDNDFIKNSKKTSKFLVILFSFGIIATLLMLQPDFSALVVYLPILVVLFYLSGINRKFLNYLLLFSMTTIVLFLLKSYMILNKDSLAKFFRWFLFSLIGFNMYYIIFLIGIGFFIIFIWWLLKKLLFRVSIVSLFLTIFVIYSSYTIVVITHKFIKPYQNRRIIAFLNPYLDPTGGGYQVIQTRIAIGSGRILGKGIFNSTQAKLGFVPEKHTDFIFSLIGEELGFIGSVVVLFLYLIIILEGIKITSSSIDTYGSLVAGSITVMFSFYFFVNTGMCLGIFPVVGLPLPFVSYGGSNLVVSYIAIGILNSINIRRFLY